MTLVTAALMVIRRTRPINTGGIRSLSPPRPRRDDDRRDDGRSDYGRNRRELPSPGGIVGSGSVSSTTNVNGSVLRRRESARDWDRSRDYDRKR